MKDKTLHLISILLAGCSTFPALAQNFSSSSNLKPQPTADRVVPFRLSDKGITHKYVEWGADIAWLDENNLRRSAAFMGKDNLDVVRTSFQPDLPIVDGKMQQGTIDTLQMRVNMFKWVKPDVKLMINCDAPFMSTYYTDENGANAAHWAEIIDLSTKMPVTRSSLSPRSTNRITCTTTKVHLMRQNEKPSLPQSSRN